MSEPFQTTEVQDFPADFGRSHEKVPTRQLDADQTW